MPAVPEIRFTGVLTAARGGGAAIEVDVVLRRDDAPREVEVPPELERALNDAGGARSRDAA